MNSLIKLFCKLATIPSPSGSELNVARFIKEYLHKSKIKSYFDSNGENNNSNVGNLIVNLSRNKKSPTILFVSHIDTVETGEEKIKPIVKKNIIASDKTTVLGADNKAAVACMLQILEDVNNWQTRPNIITAFTTREESGKMGSSFLKLTEKIDYCFNLDGDTSPGVFINQNLGEVPFEIALRGKAAHAAIEPEKGINAIKTASRFINTLPIGRRKNGNILNIGKIHGGKGNNIVPDKVILEGQVRSFTQKGIDGVFKIIDDKLYKVCSGTGCQFEIIKRPDEGAPPGSSSKNKNISRLAKEATKSLGIKFRLEKGYYTCDANFLADKYPVLTLACGGRSLHSVEEFIDINDLLDAKRLILEIIKQVTYFKTKD